MFANINAAQRLAPESSCCLRHRCSRRSGRRSGEAASRRDLKRCLASAAPPQGPGQPNRDEMQARIAKAREYKNKQGGQSAGIRQQPPSGGAAAVAAASLNPPIQQQQQQQPQAASDLPSVASAVVDEQPAALTSEQLAAAADAKLLQALSDVRPSPSPSKTPPATAMASPAAGSREAVLARMQAARQYKQQPSGNAPSSGTPASTASPNQTSGSPAAAASPPRPPSEPAPAQADEQTEAERQRSFRTGAGGAEQPANWLIFAEKPEGGSGGGGSTAGIDTSLSAEQFTLAKEEAKKQQTAEVITGDKAWAGQVRTSRYAQLEAEEAAAAAKAAGTVVPTPPQAAAPVAAAAAPEVAAPGAPAAEEGGELHKPAVTTWGVFPRPKNISEAYGGGRNLPPGKALESEVASKEREARVSAKLKEYRKAMGLEIDPAVEAQAQALYQEGLVLFDDGHVSLALPKFAAATELMVVRSRLGGEARLQQAICLDSLGRNQEAYELYKSIESHSAPGVAKKAKRMLFGWKAAETLKTGSISYQPSTQQWKRYFDAVNRNAAYAPYVASATDEEQGGGNGGFVAVVSLVMAVLGFVAYRAML
ncbi:hypothetical protein D9Q98_008589 [Chlorella vulgaris]|uniref:Uncharacterized protein n=1 Tax=Chlorella vulgaris TaxID=3077 RepID=A0A9D4TI85_CHLVU|nr:hypothetical protein D9Q98_008589 [Chlorella vulgaris]